MLSDLKYAFRQLAKSPGFTTVAVLTLALGIGFSTSTFSTTNAFLLRDVPYPESGRLVRVFRTSRQSLTRPHAPGNIMEIGETAASFSGFALYNEDNYALGEPGQSAEQVSGLAVTADFFNVLRVQPALGRGFAAGDDQPDKGRIAVITHRAWMRRYGGDPGVIGRTVRLNSQPFTIIGVLPPAFEAPLVWGPSEFIIPQIQFPGFRTQRTNAFLHCVARLKPGVSLHQAQAELGTIATRLAKEYPKENGGDGLRVVKLHDSNLDGTSRSLTWLMTGLSLTMLLIACANLASLQVARALGRSRDFAVRAALGGNRRQLMGPLLAESMVLALIGGSLGLLVASWSNNAVGRFLIINNEAGFSLPLDWRVVVFALLSSLLSGLAFGLAPAWLAAGARAAEALKEGSRSATASRSHQRLKCILIVGELALALALVGIAASFGVGAKLFSHRPLGWQPDGLFAGYVVLPMNRYPDDARRRDFQRAVLDRLAAIPGVKHAALSTNLPVYAIGGARPLIVEGQPAPERGREPIAESGSVSSDFFAALQISLKQGALFSTALKADDPPVAIVNEAFAQRFWPGENPIGRRVRFADRERWMQIVGVVGNVRMAVRADEPETRLQLYRPLVQTSPNYFTIALRADMSPEMLAPAVRQAVAALDADLPVARAGSLRAEIDRMLSNVNLMTINLGISATMGLLIAAIGLFGVISQLAIQRTRDIGVRIALGAHYRDIMGMVLGEGVRLLVIGVALGVPAFLALNIFVQRTIPEVPLPGLWLLATNIAVLTGTMLLACWLPAHRATRVNPVEALRAE
ncbi:MAG TPA: ABC transporter permease [Opitutaceae bacterium]|nr:ABC transporter permease [Opitutaceae bacterium]